MIPTNGHIPAIHSEDAVSGSFESLSSSSDDEPPELPERKPRSSSGPPAYSVNNPYANSLDRKKSGSLGRKIEKSAFFNDPDALHCGILHQRSFLAVWKKRYCKVKNDLLMIYRFVGFLALFFDASLHERYTKKQFICKIFRNCSWRSSNPSIK